ncbi:MAG: hypothetical protein AAGF20_00510 [Pseudomonadota bacterium]
MADYTPPKPHYGGHLGLIGLLAMIGLTGCVAFNERMASTNAWMPSWAQQTRGEAPKTTRAQAVTEAQMKAVYIVRFEPDPDLISISKGFRKDPTGSRAAFLEWTQGRPALDCLSLISASYSGELILGLPEENERSADEALEGINAMDNLVYAERDVMAGVGSQEGSE